ncbi:hypothetical protein [Xanthocytophaga flava]|uniref:hypothetical protein n=1 Tax=Xanthocytophaga flava TaxID=3048013 RepID=UPI0028D7A2D8|nr:hypothetical protein [Xanthocytophaga flavus]MDJ1467643.1 hypothetical protein [Xanthocytophaga flavus]
MERADLFIENIQLYFDFLSDWEAQRQEWLFFNSSFEFTWDSLYYTFVDWLCGHFILDNKWDWAENIFLSDLLKSKLYRFAQVYDAFFMNEDYPFHSHYQYHYAILNDSQWKEVILLANEVKILLETNMYICT